MADDTSTPFPSGSASGRAEGRGNRPGPGRDGGGGGRDGGGGFRIRLSDNEMQAARALQEAFGLRSTVAVLGFALRTLAQQLEEGQLDELVARAKAEASSRPRGGERGGDRRGAERGEPRRGGRGDAPSGRANPFARPSRPAPAAPQEPAAEAVTEPSQADEAAPAVAEPESGADSGAQATEAEA